MEPLFEHSLSLAGYRTRVLELEGSGAPVVMFHGYGDSADTWRLMLDRFAREGRRAIAVDLPGFGKASLLNDDAPVLAQLVRFGSALVRRWGEPGETIVMGNSLGGCLAMLLAEKEELALGGVVPIAPAGLDMARWLAIIEREPLLRTMLKAPLPLHPLAVRAVVGQVYRRLVFHRPGAIDGAVISAFTSHHGSRKVVSRYLDTARRLLPELADPFTLDRVSCPVLLVWGERDRLVFHTGARRVLDTVDGSAFELIPDCGHCPQLECPDLLAELIAEFPGRALPRAA